MGAYLVVAHQTAASPELLDLLKQMAAADRDAAFVLLVPATEARHLLIWVEGDQEEIARRRADEAAAALRREGLTVLDAVVGPSDPVEAIRREFAWRGRQYERIVISTLPPGVSRWLRRDLPSRVRSQFNVEVIHVVSGVPRGRGSGVKPSLRPAANGGDLAPGPPLTLQEAAAWLGKHLYCPGGDLGEVREIIYDYVTGEPIWLGVPSKPLPFRTLLVPAGHARVVDGYLTVPVAKARVLGQPPLDIGEGFASLTDAEHVYNYFGIPFEELRDIRVLRMGEPYPGSQRNWQNIIQTETSPARR
jgi:hypothetical protein